MSRYPELSIQYVEEWRRRPHLLASGQTRDGKQKRFMINADGWAYVYVNDVLISTWVELQSAITDYNNH